VAAGDQNGELMVVEEKIKVANNRIQKLETAIDGNGSEGLKAKVTRLEEQVGEVKSDMVELNKLKIWAAGIIITVILGCGSVVAALIAG